MAKEFYAITSYKNECIGPQNTSISDWMLFDDGNGGYKKTSTIYWGDGTSNSINTTWNNYVHSYSTIDEYIITFSDKIVELNLGAFMYSHITEVYIPDTISSLPSGVFYQCTYLKKIHIPESITSISDGFIRESPNIISYELHWEESPITYSSSKFPTQNETTFTIPKNTKQLYINAGYPSEKLIERIKINKLHIKKDGKSITIPSEEKIQNSLDTKLNIEDAFSGSYSDLSDKPSIPSKTSDLTNDSGFINQHQDISGKANTSDLSTVAITGSYSDLTNKPTLSSLNGQINISKQATPDTGYSATYIITQGNTQLTPKINIPKDFLVKSGEIKTVTTINNPIQGYKVGDKYLDFIVNTIDDDDTDSHIYINVKELIDVYNADNNTLILSNDNVFSIKTGGVAWSHLTSTLQTTINDKINASNLSTVATTGSYNDLSNKPSIPSKTSDLTNDSGFINQHQDISGKANTSDLSTVAISGSYNDLSNKPNIPSASSSTPSADVNCGAIGSSGNYAKADHQHPLSSAYATSGHTHSDYISKTTGSSNLLLASGSNIAQSTFATSGHNHSGTYAPVSHTQASTTITDMDVVQVVVTYTDNTTETLNLFKKVVSQ